MNQGPTRNLSNKQTIDLRAKNVLFEDEFAYIAGDLVIAEHAVTGTKRILGESAILNEDGRRVLKG
tara:strand:+ start:391 stop:588 length:198 start_codon:yes stop_codon:yes gene_type:complete